MQHDDKDAGVTAQKSDESDTKITMGVDPAKGIDHTTMLIFRLNKDGCDLLHQIMVRRNHMDFALTLTDLIVEEARRHAII